MSNVQRRLPWWFWNSLVSATITLLFLKNSQRGGLRGRFSLWFDCGGGVAVYCYICPEPRGSARGIGADADASGKEEIDDCEIRFSADAGKSGPRPRKSATLRMGGPRGRGLCEHRIADHQRTVNVSDGLKNAVDAAIAKFDFRPNAAARGSRSQDIDYRRGGSGDRQPVLR